MLHASTHETTKPNQTHPVAINQHRVHQAIAWRQRSCTPIRFSQTSVYTRWLSWCTRRTADQWLPKSTARTRIIGTFCFAQGANKITTSFNRTRAIAYVASVGGIGTPIGTPPNIIFISVYEEVTGREIDFITWMKTAVPIVIVSIPIMALWLTRNVSVNHAFKLPEVGEWRRLSKQALFCGNYFLG